MRVKTASLLFLLPYLVIYGCGGGGGTSVNLDAQSRTDLVGTWRLARGGSPGLGTVTCPGVIMIGGGTPIACTANFTVTLRSDGSFTAFNGSTGTWNVNNGKLTAA